MKLIDKEVIIEFVEKKSRFIGYAKPVNSVKKANDYIDSIKKCTQLQHIMFQFTGL